MTVGELIEALEGLPADRRVMLLRYAGDVSGELQTVTESVYGIGGQHVDVVELSSEYE